MTVFLQDSGRPGRLAWFVDAVRDGVASGVVLSAFETPATTMPRRPSATRAIAELEDAGAEVFLDAYTHTAVLPGTNAFAVYRGWPFWPEGFRTLATASQRRSHVEAVLESQDRLGVSLLGPTLTLETPVGQAADRFLEMAAVAMSVSAETAIEICGTSGFWTQGDALDDLVGAVAQLRAQTVFVSTLRPALRYPIDTATREEIAGFCRSVDSLARRSRIVVPHGDLFGLPAIAAGASALGTGWDLRQRMLAPDAFRTGTQGRATQRITLLGLLAVLRRQEVERLERLDEPLLTELVPGPYPRDRGSQWTHHQRVMRGLADRLVGEGTPRRRTRLLGELYVSAGQSFARVESLVRPLNGSGARWLSAVRLGLRDYATSEGWPT
jgi:hypothetical protein